MHVIKGCLGRLLQYKKIAIALTSVLLFFVMTYLWAQQVPDSSFTGVSQININQPEVMIKSQALSDLPKDLLTVPMLNAALTEDFLFFYQTDEDWLGLKGALRRIMFDHDLTWKDKLIDHIADGAADIYLWRDGKGALSYWSISLERSLVGGLAQTLAQLKLKIDQQVTQIGDFDGSPVFLIELKANRKLVLATKNNRVLLLSHVAMLDIDNGQLSQSSRQFLNVMLNAVPQAFPARRVSLK